MATLGIGTNAPGYNTMPASPWVSHATPNYDYWWYGGQKQGPAPPTSPVRQALGNAVEKVGHYAAPFKREGYLSEAIAGGPTKLTGQAQAAEGPAQQPVQQPAPPADYPQRDPASTIANMMGQGGYTSQDEATAVYNADPDRWEREFGSLRESAEEQARRQLEAAMGVFETRKQGLMNRIPGLKEQLGLRLSGLDEQLEGFRSQAERQKAQLMGGLDEELQNVQETYNQAARQTRQTAKGLARQLRNMFTGRGSIDSTQYRDMNIEQAREIAQAVGDLNREQAGKQTAIGREREDLKSYFTEQVRAEEARINQAKQQEQLRTDQLIQGIMDDVNLTDAQKVEAVVNAQNRLTERMGQLEMQEQELAQRREESDRDYALKVAQLQQKGTSTGYKNALDQGKALKNALATIEILRNDLGVNLSTEMVAKVFKHHGLREEDAEQYAGFFDAPADDQLNPDEQQLLQSLG